MTRPTMAAVTCVLVVASVSAQESKGFEDILENYVRDGQVYYRALKSDRGRLDGYVSRLANATVDGLPRPDQIAFWINAYDALVLRTVIDNYPIQRRSNAYPQKSIRQIPGAFERLTHRVAGRTVTLDQIEQTVLAGFQDPRIYLALARGADGGGRLRSEPFTGARLESQLTEATNECIARQACARVDLSANKVVMSPLFSWHEKDFTDVYASKAPPVFSERSPVERAVLALLQPKLLTTEVEFIQKNAFKMEFGEFDWRLNDLTGRGGR